MQELLVEDPLMQSYIAATARDIIPRLSCGLKENDLTKLFISFKQDDTYETLQFAEGEMLSNEAFRTLTEEIRSCRFVLDKLNIIQQEIRSISDLVDLLGACCLFDNEYAKIFESLDDTVLALLIQRLPDENSTEINEHLTENEKEWHEKFRQFLRTIDPVRRNALQYLADQIRWTWKTKRN